MPGTKRQPTRSTSTPRRGTSTRKSAAAKPASRGPKASAVRRSAAARPRPRRSAISRISPERWVDIIGVILTLLGFLTMLGLLSPQRSDGIGVWIGWVATVAGWGSIVLPLGLILSGIWLVLRNVERLPSPSAERLTGMVLLYLNILAWMHLLGKQFAGLGGWELAAAGQGGGYIGAFFEQITTALIGTLGAYVVFIGWALIALALTLDASVSEIFQFFQQGLASLVRRINNEVSTEHAARLARQAEQERLRAIPELDAYGQPKRTPLNGMKVDTRGMTPLSTSAKNGEAGAPSSDLPPDYRPMPAGAHDPNLPETLPGRPAQSAVPSRPRAGQPGRHTQQDDAAARTLIAHPVPLPPWKLPPIESVLDASPPVSAQNGKDEEDQRARLIEETLASFGCPVKVVKINAGPTVTQFGVEPLYIETRNGKTRVRVSKIVALADDLALALAAPRIRIQAPVPGRAYVGIEVPNLEVSRVSLRDVMESEAFRKIKSPLRFALGKDVAGNSKSYDLAGMPHLLIAGTTGSGKSVCVNSILTCLLINNSPTELRMILVDPKRVELTGYNGIPHLLAPVIVEAEEVVGALQWVQREMDARYHRFSQVGARNIADYNARYSPPLPYMLVLVDELADLMMLAPDETERSLTRLAQLARATGIHLVLATQRPSVDVVTGLIKANFPARVAFAVASGTDSRVILDQPGAERLLGRGDMLFQAPDAAAPVRLQGVYVSDAEIQDLVEYWRQQAYELRDQNMHTPTATPVNMELPANTPLKQSGLFGEDGGGKSGDPITNEAIRIVRTEGKASISMLQRKLRIGYTRAARLIDQLEEMGIVGPSQPTSQVREVLDYGDDENNSEAENHLSDPH